MVPLFLPSSLPIVILSLSRRSVQALQSLFILYCSGVAASLVRVYVNALRIKGC